MSRKSELVFSAVYQLSSTDEQPQEIKSECVQEIETDKLIPFEHHPFKVTNDEEMQTLCDSIEEHGVLSPLIERPKNDGYETSVVTEEKRRLKF